MRTASRSATVTNVTSTFKKIWPLVKRYWFDVLVVAGIGASIAVAVAHQHLFAVPDEPDVSAEPRLQITDLHRSHTAIIPI